MRWYDLKEETPTKGSLFICKSIFGEYCVMEFLSDPVEIERITLVWEFANGDYRSPNIWRYWVPIREIEDECEKNKPIIVHMDL